MFSLDNHCVTLLAGVLSYETSEKYMKTSSPLLKIQRREML